MYSGGISIRRKHMVHTGKIGEHLGVGKKRKSTRYINDPLEHANYQTLSIKYNYLHVCG